MLDGKTALVTGASRGIGRAIALALAKDGADLALLATKENENSASITEEIRAMGRSCEFYACDITDPDRVNETVASVIETFKGLDILVNNAGITRDMLLIQMKEEDFECVLNVNLKGCFNMTRACLRPFIRNKGGRIINISSVVGLMGNTGQANYSASKAGIIGFTKSVAREYGSKGICCNAIAPGFISTEMTDAISDEKSREMLESIPLKRYGKPEDVANAVLFLCQDASGYITGEVLNVSGGLYM